MTPVKVGRQTGGTFLGFIAGLVCGLAVAVAVAIFITKAPIPFVDKTGNKGVDAQPIAGVQLPDPNKPFYSKDAPGVHAPSAVPVPAPAVTPPTTSSTAPAGVSVSPPTPVAATAPAATTKPSSTPAAAPTAPASDKKLSLFDVSPPPTSAPPAAAPAKPESAADDGKARYLLQAGAFKTEGDAEAMRAKLTLLGMDAKVSAGEKDGATLYRVRIGPINKLDELNRTRQTLVQNGIEPSIISVR